MGEAGDRRSGLNCTPKKLVSSYKHLLESEPLKQVVNSPDVRLPLTKFSVDFL